ncbi:MAG TPA: DUF202 domain-containing protein [Usitatibacter sp.]|nr:DUF202 domain-containing protein [Usitatibacter sp.]
MSGYDPGVQRERTALAWSRTGLAVLVNALIVLRAGAQANQLFVLALGFMLVAASGGAVVVGGWRSRRLAADADPTTPWFLVVATVCIVWLASVAAVGAIAVTARP